MPQASEDRAQVDDVRWIARGLGQIAQYPAGAISEADRTWLLIGLPVALIGEVANIARWQILMRVQGMYMSWRRAIMLFFVGLFFNLFMPGYTGGDFARLARRRNTDSAFLIASIEMGQGIGDRSVVAACREHRGSFRADDFVEEVKKQSGQA